MVTASRVLSSDDSPTDGRVETLEVSSAMPVMSVVRGGVGVIAGLFGALVIAASTVVDRLLVFPWLYESAGDVLLHAAAEIVAATVLWLCLRALLELPFRAERLLPVDPARRRRVVRYVLLLAGIGVGCFLYAFVVRLSSRVAMLPPAAWVGLLSLFGCGLSFGGYALVTRRLPQRAFWVAFPLLGCAVGAHLFALHRYFRHYGNLHSLILMAVTLAAALACGVLLRRLGPKLRRSLSFAALALTVMCALPLLLVSPSIAARNAVLVWGGVAKRMLIGAAWPLLDGDGDGLPQALWGVDPDDRDPSISALTSRRVAPPREAPLAIPMPSTRRNVLWIVVDTVRYDSFERVRASPLGRNFDEFAYFSEYRSCSSRTGQVISQVLGDDRCDARTVPGLKGNSLLAILAAEGYRSHLVGYFSLPFAFTTAEQLQHDDAIVARSRELLRGSSPERRALFVHLKGAHQPYDGPGATERERYEASVDAAFARVAELLRDVPPDWAVVILGDHGEEFGEHAAHAHATTLYQEVLRTPLLLRAPEFPAGRHTETIGCASVPWKTLVAAGMLAHAPEPLDFQYAALDIARGEFGYLQDSQLRSVERNGKKLIWSPGLGIWELYDLRADPGETRNLARREPALLLELQGRLTMLSRQCGHLGSAGSH